LTQLWRLTLRPHGALHLGAARLLLLGWRMAREAGARVELFIHDTEAPAPEVVAGAERDLAWLGLDWDTTIRASTIATDDSVAALKQTGRLYPCWEPEAELAARRRWRIRRGQNPAYDRSMLKLSDERRAELMAERAPYWRFKLTDGMAAWRDLCRGIKPVPMQRVDDPVLLDAAGQASLLLRMAAFDLAAGTTAIAAAEDRLTETAAMFDIRAVLAPHLPLPQAAHFPLLPGLEGPALRSLTLHRLRADGVLPAPLRAYLEGAQKFDMQRLLGANRAALRYLPFADVAAQLPEGATEEFWLAVRGHLDLLDEASHWWRVVAGEIDPPEFLNPKLAAAARALPENLATAWETLQRHAEAATLRRALTGEDSGPPMETLLPLIGRDRAFSRLMQASGTP
jgi:glutamyl-tRNA synthetase